MYRRAAASSTRAQRPVATVRLATAVGAGVMAGGEEAEARRRGGGVKLRGVGAAAAEASRRAPTSCRAPAMSSASVAASPMAAAMIV